MVKLPLFGCSKHDDIEMPTGEKPDNSHSTLANAGDDKKIVRDNVPFGSMASNEMGTYFIAYSKSFTPVEEMLRRVYQGVPYGNYDRLLDYSTPHTGTLYFVPTADMLSDFEG